ncbi:transposable element Tcb1 transposase [Trichonephila clavipes]|nr:transposable element Tcb1 transposase [Trichonephila clavipes]
MSRRKQRSAFDQVSEFDTERTMAYRDCGLSFREIDSRVGRNQTTVMRICECWIQDVRQTNVVDRIHLCAPLHQSGLSARRPLLGLPLMQNHRRLRRQWCKERRTHCRFLNSQRYISEVLEPVVLPYFQGLATAIFQQDKARPHMARIVQRFFVKHQI